MEASKRAPRPCFLVKNWKEFQHYGSARHAIWIKFYARLLDDVDGVLVLPEVAQAHLFKLWLLALRHDNAIPFSKGLAWIAAEIEAQSLVDFELLIREGWLIPKNIPEDDLVHAIAYYRSSPSSASAVAITAAIKSSIVKREEKRRVGIS
jgi:hypothetical protein